jgi:MerR family redox-sensitive transcriptional activator SoxR
MDTEIVPGEARFPIGAVAKRAGLRVSALRYYEQAGLIAPAPRVGGRRVYDDTVFSSIALVQLAQEAGFTVAETRTLVSGFTRGTPASARWQAMARRKLADVAQRIEQAERMKRLLERLLQCRCETLEQCVQSRSDALRTAAIPRARPAKPA